jgi:hypothetical protein
MLELAGLDSARESSTRSDAVRRPRNSEEPLPSGGGCGCSGGCKDGFDFCAPPARFLPPVAAAADAADAADDAGAGLGRTADCDGGAGACADCGDAAGSTVSAA